jgi:hypothetical protein
MEMAPRIQAIFIDPPIAVARLGGSNIPMDSFRWVDAGDPHLQTAVSPDWSLDVDQDGFVSPRMPESLTFRDGGLIRPVAPFFEIWALNGEDGSDPASWQQIPLTADLLNSVGGTFTVTVDARNRKAARRARNPNLVFGTFPPVTTAGDHHRPVPLVATSPTGIVCPMIPRGSPGIPLGSFQLMHPQPQPPVGSVAWASSVRVDILRFRFTPAKGQFYGPAGIDLERFQGRFRESASGIRRENAFLDAGAGWVGTRQTPWVEPADTFDGTENSRDQSPLGGPSVGIVDDTCSAIFMVTLTLPNRAPLTARACGFVSPPDFAPDRRPFLSLADELNDRSARAVSTSTPDELDSWVRDLFERIYETASLFNLDFWRIVRGATIPDAGRLDRQIAGDRVRQPEVAMGSLDKLRDPNQPIQEVSSQDVPLPLTERARQRHRDLAELESLRVLVQEGPQRLAQLVREPFTMTVANPNEPDDVQRSVNESGILTNMQMPPFMRNSNANPLTLSNWQYNLLMRWAAGLQARGVAARAAPVSVAPLSERAAARQRRVLARLGRE